MTNTDTASTHPVTIGRGTAVHAAGVYGTVCADTVRPGHAAARIRPAHGPITCKSCRKALGLPVDAPAAPAPAPAPRPGLTAEEQAKREKIRGMRREIARLLKAGDREAALALDAEIQNL